MACTDGSNGTKGKAGSTAKQGGHVEGRTRRKAAIRHAVRRYLCVTPQLARRKGPKESRGGGD